MQYPTTEPTSITTRHTEQQRPITNILFSLTVRNNKCSTRPRSLHQLLRDTPNNTDRSLIPYFLLQCWITNAVSYNLYSWRWTYKCPKNVELVYDNKPQLLHQVGSSRHCYIRCTVTNTSNFWGSLWYFKTRGGGRVWSTAGRSFENKLHSNIRWRVICITFSGQLQFGEGVLFISWRYERKLPWLIRNWVSALCQLTQLSSHQVRSEETKFFNNALSSNLHTSSNHSSTV
jgi:hypothetical protein